MKGSSRTHPMNYFSVLTLPGISCHWLKSSLFPRFPGSGISCQLTIDHEYFVWNISTIFTTAAQLPTCVPAKLPWFTEVLRRRNLPLPLNLHWQNLSWTVVCCITYQKGHMKINTFTSLSAHTWLLTKKKKCAGNGINICVDLFRMVLQWISPPCVF